MSRRSAAFLLAFLGLAWAQMTLESPAFAFGAPIPVRYTCDGEDLSPPLVWRGVPAAASSLVLVVWDPDAPVGVFFHWSAYDLSKKRTGLAEGVPPKPRVGEFKQGKNDFQRVGYGGPCPPRGHGPHRYFFRLYALKEPALGLPPGAPARAVLEALKTKTVLARAEWMGTYAR